MLKMENQALKETLEILIQQYEYASAYRLVEQQRISGDAKTLLYLMKKRRQLAIEELYGPKTVEHFQANYDCQLTVNPQEQELLANYIMDLQAKVITEDIIDFVRAVSPILYRLFLRLIQSQIPDLPNYVKNSKDSSYDTWKFSKMEDSQNQALQDFASTWHDPRVTSRSLVALIELLTNLRIAQEGCDLPQRHGKVGPQSAGPPHQAL
ncbi:hypothetical protein D823_02491 [Streptococcus sobrinus DSM 20742 = ATCC 33478]|nr:hypothetical protein D823_02491 [Streptococcus sobrinus DSM 20742 = ATCC 33478]